MGRRRLPRAGFVWRATDIVDGAVFDADHDGDVDIWLVNAAGATCCSTTTATAASGNRRHRRRGRGRSFVARAGRRGSRQRSRRRRDGAQASEPPHDVFLNDRVWAYHRDDKAARCRRRHSRRRWRAISTRTARGRSTHWDGRARALAPRGGGVWRSESMVASESAAIATRDRRYRRRRPLGGRGERRRTDAPGGWTVAHLDAARGPSVVGVGGWRAGDWGPGSGRHTYLGFVSRVAIRRAISADPTSLASGRASPFAPRRDGPRFDTTRLASGPGQSLQPTTVGLAGAARRLRRAYLVRRRVSNRARARYRPAAPHWRDAASVVELSGVVRVGRQPLPVRD